MLRPSSLPRHLLSATLVLCALILGGVLLELGLSYSTEKQEGRKRLDHLTNLIAEHTSRSLEAVDILLRELTTDLSGDKHWAQWPAERGFEYLSTRHTRSLPQLRNLAILDQQGNQKFISTQFPSLPINVRDQPYFVSLERGADFAMYGPYVGRNSGRYTYALARSLKDQRQEFAGAVFAAIEPAYFQEFCWSIRLSDDFESVLVNTQGRIVASCRPTDLSQQSPLIGANVSDALAGGALRHRSPTAPPDDHGGWLISQTTVGGFPDLRIITLIPEATLLQHWRQRLKDYLILSTLALSLLALGGWLLRQQNHRFLQLHQSLAGRCQQLEQQVEASALKLEQQKQEAERANAAKSRFLAAASHDLRQPLHALALFASDLQRQIRLQKVEQLPHLGQQIQSSTEVLSELLDSLLDISRLDVAGITPKLRHHPVKDIFTRLATTFERAAQAKGLSLRFRDHDLNIYTDAGLLERLLANLVSNAIRYTEQGGVLVSARQRKGQVLIEVRDTGIGIPAEHQQAIFVEFYQINNAARESHKGLGLGLSIVDRLARALGIRIELTSQSGKGTRFGFLLPRGEAARKIDSSGEVPVQPNSPPLICILGASPELDEAARLIRVWGYPVAHTYLEHRPPQILLSDATNVETLQNQFAGTPIIALCDASTTIAPNVHRLALPLRPARLRALLRRLEEEITT